MHFALVINRKIMQLIKIKPLSINEAWKGRRFKTDKYKRFERSLLYLLTSMQIPTGQLELKLEFGFSNKLSDLDNPVKLVQDILQKKYKFNDNQIYRLTIDKKIVKKGDEYIKFKIIEYRD